MKLNIQEQKLFTSISNRLQFSKSNIDSFVLISDKVKIPIYTSDKNIKNYPSEVISVVNHHKGFIETICSNLENSLHFTLAEHGLEDHSVSFDIDSVSEKYIDIVIKACDRNGMYKDQYELIEQLTLFSSSIDAFIRIGLKAMEDEPVIKPVFVLQIKLNIKNSSELPNVEKFKTFELDLFALQ